MRRRTRWCRKDKPTARRPDSWRSRWQDENQDRPRRDRHPHGSGRMRWSKPPPKPTKTPWPPGRQVTPPRPSPSLKPVVDTFRGLPTPWAERASGAAGRSLPRSRPDCLRPKPPSPLSKRPIRRPALAADIGLARLAGHQERLRHRQGQADPDRGRGGQGDDRPRWQKRRLRTRPSI